MHAKPIAFLAIVGAMIFAACAPKTLQPLPTATLIPPTSTPEPKTWEYVVMGVMARSVTSYIPEQYAAYIEQDMGVNVVIHEQPRWELNEILENLRSNEELRTLIRDAEVITFDFSWDFLNVPEGEFVGGFCGGEDNQDCLRAAVSLEKDNWNAIMDLLAELRAGSPVLLRTFIIGDHTYGFRYWMLSSDKKEVIKGYYNDYQVWVEAEGLRREIAVVRALPDPYFDLEDPPVDFLQSDDVHFSEQGSQLLADALRALGYEFRALK